ncbi:hypothetical protein Xen7305DRAFT_00007840 [Xenococcus sp. PCC 7305]|uniref:hypothetical protein n=1 Tax=Xenococcus sp. PCC 7305 TaxID=102125 RepID=UPI0002AC8B6A|nr:hypothetical protein [Xenococcus sp. PCC 7305]ELS01083.1 hypothetical protein Xen7305DRAFT_00007840 [Xenococcus sp. PCC 7305]
MTIEEKSVGQDKLPTNKLKSDQKTAVEEKLSQDRISESPESMRNNGATAIVIILISIYGATILFCFGVISFGLVTAESKDILTLLITSQVVLIGSAIGFYFGRNQ